MDILDTAGQEEYSAMRDEVIASYGCLQLANYNSAYLFFSLSQYVRTGQCFMMVYSITDKSSFDQVQAMYDWITRLRDGEMPMVLECLHTMFRKCCKGEDCSVPS